MKRFLKDNMDPIIKMIVYQVGAVIMGVTTQFAVAGRGPSWLYPAASVFCVVFYLFLIYQISYVNGQKDGIRIEAGKIGSRPQRFFLVALVANSLNLFIGVLPVIIRLILGVPLSGNIETAYSPEWLFEIQEVLATLARFIMMMYLGIIQAISDRSVVLLAISPLPAILVAGVAYILGVKFKDGFLPKKEKKDGAKRYR